MMTIYHNPRCSKSRQALALVQQFCGQNNIPLNIIDYLQTPPSLAQLSKLHRQLGIALRQMVRDNEEEFAAWDLAHADDAALLQALADCPKLLQRPIVVYRERAMIGRPPEALYSLLQPA
jgi:arsenate reductase (glutaredoxin)